MRRLNLTAWILIGLLLGVGVGVFFGERAAVLKPIGDGFIRLLQMAVLPYFIVALPLGFGRLTYDEVKQTGLRMALFSLLIWSLGFLLVGLLPLTFPTLESASFFSSSSVEPSRDVNFVELYIPANPFNSLSDAVIPGVVVFGIALGIALIGVPQKRLLLEMLDSLADALGRITGFVVKLTPIGVFALAASAAGTMTLADLSRLQVYLVAYTVGAALLTFWLVPMFVATLTPFGFGDVLRATRDPLVTGFTTGNLLVVLPMLAENCKQLFQEQEERNRRHAEAVVDVVMPISFTFPNLGVVLLLLFIPFAGWFTGAPVQPGQFPKMFLLGFFSFFGSVEIGLPFLLEQLRIPTDLFQLHVVTLVYIGRLATLLAVAHLSAVALLTAAGNARWLRFRPRKLAGFAGASAAILMIAVALTGRMLAAAVDGAYSKDKVLTAMQSIQTPLHGDVYREPPPALKVKEDETVLAAIRRRGVLRVGFDPEGLPFSFFNRDGALVGFDVELTQALADELGVRIEYYPFQKPEMAESLNENRCYDLLIGGLFATTNRIEKMRFSEPYLDLHLAFVAADHRKDEFTSFAALRRRDSVRIAVLERPYFAARIQRAIPRAQIELVRSPRAFFESEGAFDALAMSAEAGSAWTLLHPEFDVAVPQDLQLTIGVGFPMPADAVQLENLVSRWIDLKQKDGSIAALYRHWIEGESAEPDSPRWSVATDVLGWLPALR